MSEKTPKARGDGPGKGAAFEVRLPLTAAPAREPKEPEQRPARARRVLIVEDNPDLAQTLRELMEISGHEVAVAGTAPEALEILRSEGADVVLCDLGLPGMSGEDFAREVRKDAALASIPLIALSGRGQARDRNRTAEAGFDTHLVKPVDLDLLNATLEGLK